MKSISILGTTSNAGKSWLNTAFCTLMRRKGINVAPFKAQNMSNNSFVTLEGGEIGRAQAAQAEACGMRPIAEMNPILLKPSGDSTSQIVRLGVPGEHVRAGSYYKDVELLRELVNETLDWWKPRCELLMLEGAGSPSELNLMDRDVVNLHPSRYLNGKWILAADIERGGVFAQGIGTVQLMPKADQDRGIGLVINKFRGDPKLFSEGEKLFAEHIATPYLGVLPLRSDLQPETEDGFTLNTGVGEVLPQSPYIAWVCYPRVSNSQDMDPWTMDTGVHNRWVKTTEALQNASAIVLPGSKNTIADLQWLREQGFDQVIEQKAAQGTPVLGICGGFQMLGDSLIDPEGKAGRAGVVNGLGLLPIQTEFEKQKRVVQVDAWWDGTLWKAYEIHMGKTQATSNVELQPLLHMSESDQQMQEGYRMNNVWGTYLHGFFEPAVTRRAFCKKAGIDHLHCVGERTWSDHKQAIYSGMADMLEEHLNLDSVYRYLEG